MKQLTFKEYWNSKEQLREAAVKNTPHQSRSYSVRKYCKLAVGESKAEREYVSLKPKQKIIVEWLYTDINNPTPVNLKFEGINEIDPDDPHLTFWEGAKLIGWLNRNAREETV